MKNDEDEENVLHFAGFLIKKILKNKYKYFFIKKK
jgi:hypothetical protein